MTTDTPQERESRLVEAFVRTADTLVDEYDVADMLHQLAVYCVDLLDVSAAGLMMSDQRGTLRVLAASTERTRLLELFQLQADEGPCLDSFRTGEPVSIDDLPAQDRRWPAFTPEAVKHGFAGVHAVPLRLRDETVGALNLFREEFGPMPEMDLHVAHGLANIATISVLSERAITRHEVLTEQLQTALNNRVIIEQAKGVLAQSENLDVDDAFEALRNYARTHATRLSEIAHSIVTDALAPAQVIDYGTAR